LDDTGATVQLPGIDSQDRAENGSWRLRREDATMHWLVAVLAATSGITMSFAICAFVWTWYVGTIVLVLSNEEMQGQPMVLKA
jgi:hypothetical protein